MKSFHLASMDTDKYVTSKEINISVIIFRFGWSVCYWTVYSFVQIKATFWLMVIFSSLVVYRRMSTSAQSGSTKTLKWDYVSFDCNYFRKQLWWTGTKWFISYKKYEAISQYNIHIGTLCNINFLSIFFYIYI